MPSTDTKKNALYTKVIMRNPNMIRYLPKSDVTDSMWFLAIGYDKSLVAHAPESVRAVLNDTPTPT